MRPDTVIVSHEMYMELKRVYETAVNNKYYFCDADGQFHVFDTQEEAIEFEKKYKHDKEFNNKLEDIIK